MRLFVFIARVFLTNFLRKSFSGNVPKSAAVIPLTVSNFLGLCHCFEGVEGCLFEGKGL